MRYKCKSSCGWSGGEFSSLSNAKNDHETHSMCFIICDCNNVVADNEYNSFEEWYNDPRNNSVIRNSSYQNYVWDNEGGNDDNILSHEEWTRENYGSNWLIDKRA